MGFQAFKFMLNNCARQAVYCAWAAVADAPCERQERGDLEQLFNALALQVHHHLQDPSRERDSLNKDLGLDEDPQLLHDIQLVLSIMYDRRRAPTAAQMEGEIALNPPQNLQSPTGQSSSALRAPCWPIPKLMSVEWQSLVSHALSRCVCFTTNHRCLASTYPHLPLFQIVFGYPQSRCIND
jgi:hypothetical protein